MKKTDDDQALRATRRGVWLWLLLLACLIAYAAGDDDKRGRSFFAYLTGLFGWIAGAFAIGAMARTQRHIRQHAKNLGGTIGLFAVLGCLGLLGALRGGGSFTTQVMLPAAYGVLAVGGLMLVRRIARLNKDTAIDPTVFD